MAENKNNKHIRDRTGVREVLLEGVFWRILFIEGVLLVFSLGYRAVTQDAGAEDLFWYGVRIVVLVAVIIAFMMVSLSRFLNRRIIVPLEAIDKANRSLKSGITSVDPVNLPDDTPREIRRIVKSRNRMLERILDESNQRLQLVRLIKKTFGRYLSAKVVEEILSSPENQKAGGTRRTVTVLMSDLRGFTALTEQSDPHQLMECLNRYLKEMSAIIIRYDGIIDEIMGDAVLAVFGVPEKRDNDPERAVACAIEMQNQLNVLNREFTSQEFPRMEMGIAVNTGDVVVGNIGSELRMKYGIVGTTVNEAARMESNTIGGEILIGERTFESLADLLQASSPRTVMMKGMASPLVFYAVTGISGTYEVQLEKTVNPSDNLVIRLPFRCQRIKDKTVTGEILTGHTLSINSTHIDAVILSELPRYSDVKIKILFCDNAHCFSDIYAKVVETVTSGRQTITRLGITSIRPEDRAVFQRWREDLLRIDGENPVVQTFDI